MRLLFVIFIIFTVVFDTIHTQCSTKPLANRNAPNCGVVNGKQRKFGDSWKSPDCQKCSCSKIGVGCCSMVSTPTGFDKKTCHAVFNKRQCKYDVVKKSNKNVKCPITSAVGR